MLLRLREWCWRAACCPQVSAELATVTAEAGRGRMDLAIQATEYDGLRAMYSEALKEVEEVCGGGALKEVEEVNGMRACVCMCMCLRVCVHVGKEVE